MFVTTETVHVDTIRAGDRVHVHRDRWGVLSMPDHEHRANRVEVVTVSPERGNYALALDGQRVPVEARVARVASMRPASDHDHRWVDDFDRHRCEVCGLVSE